MASDADEPISMRMSPIDIVTGSNELHESRDPNETGRESLTGAGGIEIGTMSGRMESIYDSLA